MSVEHCKHCKTILIPIKTEQGYINYHMPSKDCKKDFLHAAIVLKLQIMDNARWEEYQEEWGMGTKSVQDLLNDMEEKNQGLIDDLLNIEGAFKVLRDQKEYLAEELALARRSPLTKLVSWLKQHWRKQ